jgi:hypothetical protein
LRTMQQRNLIVPVVGDFGGPTAIRAVADFLKARNASVTAFYVSNVEQYLYAGFSPAYRRFYENVSALPLDSTSTFIRAVPSSGGTAVMPPGFLDTGTGGLMRLQIVDSGAVRVFVATGTDSLGNAISRRAVVPFPPQDLASTSAFVSGLASIRATLAAYAASQLASYTSVQAMTKIAGWER